MYHYLLKAHCWQKMRPVVTDVRGVLCPTTSVSCAKTAELIEMPFGVWARVGPENRVLDVAWIPQGRGNFYGHLPAKML